jgi:hypothetical protein
MWIVKREAELKRPDGLDHKEDPPLSTVIDRYIAESENAVLGTKAQVLESIKNGDLGETTCSGLLWASHSREAVAQGAARRYRSADRADRDEPEGPARRASRRSCRYIDKRRAAALKGYRQLAGTT